MAGVILNLAAIWLQLDLPRRIARMEERCKDGHVSDEQMGISIRRAQVMPMVCTLVGACLLVGALMRAFA